ncbi:MAG: hypothetical protein HZA93_29290 [Verrucomicrobia bacterium]|nr:hypothetical protein [Verrucomicrobiota bacterium]
MNPLRCLLRLPLALGGLILFWVLFAWAMLTEARKKQKLGAAYEGPLDGEDES